MKNQSSMPQIHKAYNKVMAMCKNKGITPYRISKDIKVSASYLSRIKHGETYPGIVLVERIAEMIGWEVVITLRPKEEVDPVEEYQKRRTKEEEEEEGKVPQWDFAD